MTKNIHVTLQIVTLFLVASVVLSLLHLYAVLNPVRAAAIDTISDIITTSAPGADATHAIVFTMASPLGATYDATTGLDVFTIYFDDSTIGGNPSTFERFDPANDLAIGDITLSGTTGSNTIAVDCTGSEAWAVTFTSTSIVFTACVMDSASVIALDTITVDVVGMLNASVAGVSYPVTIGFDDEGGGGDFEDEGETRIMILDQVVLTAEIETNLTCYVSGLADGAGSDGGVNGRTLTSDSGGGADGSASATLIDFGVITPDDMATGEAPADQEVLGQRLEVATNALNGFLWTIEADGSLRSAIGADIDEFINDAATSTPTDWTQPTGTIAATESGWGHLGLTSEDDNLDLDTLVDPGDDYTDSSGNNASCETATNEGCWVGNFLSARNIFANDGPADGDGAGGGTPDRGLTEIAFAVEVSSLQEAASDYTNTWTHICTPTY